MFHAFHIVVDGLFVDAEEAEEACERLVALNDGACDAVAFLGEDGAAVFLVFDEAFCVEALEHVGDAGLGDAEIFRDVHGASVTFLLDQMEDLFEVVVHGDGAAGALGRKGHQAGKLGRGCGKGKLGFLIKVGVGCLKLGLEADAEA